MHINNTWCTDTVTVESQCSPDLEYITLKCRPFYLPSEFTRIMITVVYMPPSANANLALRMLKAALLLIINIADIQMQFSLLPNILIMQCSPNFINVNFHLVGLNTLDKIYANIKLGYRAKQLTHLTQSDHMSLF